MKFYRCNKSILKWKEIKQLQYKWTLPILVNDELEVVIGNSLKDSLPDNIIIVKMDNNQREVLFQALYDIETKIAEENSEERLNLLQVELQQFFNEVRKPVVEYMDLFPMKEERIITPELYIEPPPYDFNKHGKGKVLFNEGCVLMEEFLEKSDKSDPEIEVDLEILKELL